MKDFASLTHMLKDASLQDILEQVQGQVKNDPMDQKAREALIKLYCVEGAWDKALVQIQTMMLMDEELKKQSELYKNLVFSEMQRTQVLSGERSAVTMRGDSSEWMAILHQANHEQNQGNTGKAEKLRNDAFDAAPVSAGKGDVIGEFGWIADSDGRIGPVCEFICAGGYRWVPFSDITKMEISKPKDILDLVWTPATLHAGDETWYGYVPARYPVDLKDEQAIKLGAKSTWDQISDTLLVGHGRKVLITDLNELSILETGTLFFE